MEIWNPGPHDPKVYNATTYRPTYDEALTIYFSLTAKYEQLVKDLESRYDNHPAWTDDEDGVFLREQIAQIGLLVQQMFNIRLPRR
jgi:hypothetical protein